jgi:hypothetical protein
MKKTVKKPAKTFDESQLIGMIFTEAKEKLGILIRAVNVDGKEVPVTCDMRRDRINVAVENGVIISICSHG